MIKRMYVYRIKRYQTLYQNPLMLPRAPKQIFVDAFSEEDNSDHSNVLRQQAQRQYDAEVDLYRALESLELKEKIVVLHNFKFSKSQAFLFSDPEESSDGEQDFVVLVRDCAIVLIEVKSPVNISNRSFKRNLTESRKQLSRAKTLIMNICAKWDIDQSVIKVLQFTAFPKDERVKVVNFQSYQNQVASTAVNAIIFQEDIQDFASWWDKNVAGFLKEVTLESPRSPTSNIHCLTSSLIGIWCTDQYDVCDIEICGLGHAVKEIDDAVRSAEITQNKLKPVSKGVKKSPPIFKSYFGVDCLTETQESVFNDDKIAQFIIGPAGSGKTLLLLGKMIEIHKRDPTSRFLIVTGTFELTELSKTLENAGLKTCASHYLVRNEALELQINKDFSRAFHDTAQNCHYDTFILHHHSLSDPTFWTMIKHNNDLTKDVLSYLMNSGFNLFIDDFHNALDCILSDLKSTKILRGYSRSVVRLIIHAMKKRFETNAAVGNTPYFWLVYDHGQMTLRKKKESRTSINLESAFFRRMTTYVRDIEGALRNEKVQDRSSDCPIFRFLTKNLRNSVDISRCIEKVYIDQSRYIINSLSANVGDIFNNLDIPKLYPETGHFIHGPKPIFHLIDCSDNQVNVENALILDIIGELLQDGKLSPEDIAIIVDSYYGIPSPWGGLAMDKVLILKCHNLEGVTVRVIEDKDSIQATEWKAVIYCTDLVVTNSIFENQPSYMIDLPPIIKSYDGSMSTQKKYLDAKSILETLVRLNFSPPYVAMSRARVYLAVIGRLGNLERKKYGELSEYYSKLKGTPMPSIYEADRYRPEIVDGCHMMVNEKGEYEYYKKDNFVYVTIPDNPGHAFLQRFPKVSH